MQLTKPKVSSGNFTDSWRPDESGTFNIRVFPFKHDGETHLATHTRIHFQGGNGAPIACLGQGCPMCAEAVSTGNKRLGASNRYPMAIVVDGDEEAIRRYDSPSSVYGAISGLLDNDDSPPEDVLGNEGIDFVIKYKKGAKNPSDVYSVSLRIKNSSEYEIDESSVPDLIEECAADNAPAVKPNDTPTENDNIVVFKDSRGKEHKGVWEGKMQKDKYIIVVDGHIRKVQADRIISGIEVGTPEYEADAHEVVFEEGTRVSALYGDDAFEGTVVTINGDEITVDFDDGSQDVHATADLTVLGVEPEQEAEPEQETEPEVDETGPSVGDEVTIIDPDDEETYEVKINKINGDNMTVENDDFDPWIVPVDSIQ